MKKRIIVAILLVLFFAPLILTAGLEPLAYVVFGCLNIMGAFELYRLSNPNKRVNHLKFLPISLISTLIYIITTCLSERVLTIQTEVNNNFLICLTLLVVFVVADITFVTNKNRKLLLQSLFYPSIGFGMISNLKIAGVKYILFAILITSLTDSFALFMGKLFGKRKLAPLISPKKTIEGAVLGTVITAVLLVPLFYFYDKIFAKPSKLNIFESTFNVSQKPFFEFIPDYFLNHYMILVLFLFFLVIFLSVLGQIGDLYASKIKRDYNIKDYSQIFPGHGGVLDRFDSLIFVGIALFAIIRICQLMS